MYIFIVGLKLHQYMVISYHNYIFCIIKKDQIGYHWYNVAFLGIKLAVECTCTHVYDLTSPLWQTWWPIFTKFPSKCMASQWCILLGLLLFFFWLSMLCWLTTFTPGSWSHSGVHLISMGRMQECFSTIILLDIPGQSSIILYFVA